MLGNDIIDFGAASPNADNQRFVDKVLADCEQEAYQGVQDKNLFLWSCWALKESAYKATFRQDQRTYFAPKKIICSMANFATKGKFTATVQDYYSNYQGIIQVEKNYLHAVVYHPAIKESTISKIIFSFPKKGSMIPETKLLQAVSDKTGLSYNQIHFKKKGQVPMLFLPQGEQLVSLSHHGYYGAFIYAPFLFDPKKKVIHL